MADELDKLLEEIESEQPQAEQEDPDQLESLVTDIEQEEESRLPPETPALDALIAAASGFSQGATLGFADEIAGSIRSVILGTPAEQEIGRLRAIQEQSQEESPVTTTVTQVLGSAPAALATGAGALRSAGLGAVEAAGLTEASVLDEPGQFLGDVALGGTIGAVVPAAFDKAGAAAKKGLNVIDKSFREKAQIFALKAAGTNKKTLKKIKSISDLRRAGQILLDEGTIRFGSNFEGLANRAIIRKDEIGKQLGELTEELDNYALQFRDEISDQLLPNTENIASRIEQEIIPSLTGLQQSEIPAFQRMANEIRDLGPSASFSELRDQKKVLSQQITAGKKFEELSLPQQARSLVRRLIREEEETAFNRVNAVKQSIGKPPKSGPEGRFTISDAELKKIEGEALNVSRQWEKALDANDKEKILELGKKFKSLKDSYGVLKLTAESGGDALERQISNRTFSLTDYIAGSATSVGFTVGQLIDQQRRFSSTDIAITIGAGLATAGANRILRNRGAASTSKVLDLVSKAAKKSQINIGDITIPFTQIKSRNLTPALNMSLIDENSPINIRGFMPIDGEFVEELRQSIMDSPDIGAVKKAAAINQLNQQEPIFATEGFDPSDDFEKTQKQPQGLKELTSAIKGIQ